MFIDVLYIYVSTLCFHPIKNEARKMNHAEVVEEDKRNKLPENWEAKRRRVEWEESQEKRRKVC